VLAAELTSFGDVEVDVAEPTVVNLVNPLGCGVVSVSGKPGVPVGIRSAVGCGGGHEDRAITELFLQKCSHREVSRWANGGWQ
jgi:hypothetical protein